MPKAVAPNIVRKILKLLSLGWSQTDIAAKLDVDQTTISNYAKKFKELALEVGVHAAADQYGVEDTVDDLFGLGAELKKSDMTVKEAKAGLTMEGLFKKQGIKQSEYPKVINVCKLMKKEGFMNAAIKLADMEEAAGTTYEQVVGQFSVLQEDLENTAAKLKTATADLDTIKKELVHLETNKAAASEELEDYMTQLGVDQARLQQVEQLAKTLKQAGIQDKGIQAAIQNLQILNNANFNLGLFADILNAAKTVTSIDKGKGLLKALSDYGGFVETIAGFKAEIKTQQQYLSNLEQQAALKGKLELEVTRLKTGKAELEPLIADLREQHQLATQLQNDINTMTPQKAALGQKTKELKAQIEELNSVIDTKEKKVADLAMIETNRDELLKETAELLDKFKKDQHRWRIYQGFLGLVHSVSKDELQKSMSMLPELIVNLPVTTSTKDIEHYKQEVLSNLTGGKLPVFLRCKTCNAAIGTDRSKPNGHYQCPHAEPILESPHMIIVEKDSTAIFKQVLGGSTLPTKKQPPSIIIKPIDSGGHK